MTVIKYKHKNGIILLHCFFVCFWADWAHTDIIQVI